MRFIGCFCICPQIYRLLPHWRCLTLSFICCSSSTDSPEVLNLTRQHLKKVDPAPGNLHYSSLLLDHNDIARLENVETYCSLIKVKHYQKFALFSSVEGLSLQSGLFRQEKRTIETIGKTMIFQKRTIETIGKTMIFETHPEQTVHNCLELVCNCQKQRNIQQKITKMSF